MCNLSKGIEEKGIAKGMARGMDLGMARGMEKGRAEGMTNGILLSIKNLTANMGLPLEQAMSVLGVPESEKQKYLDLLGRQ